MAAALTFTSPHALPWREPLGGLVAACDAAPEMRFKSVAFTRERSRVGASVESRALASQVLRVEPKQRSGWHQTLARAPRRVSVDKVSRSSWEPASLA
jgi:hypothetical protein